MGFNHCVLKFVLSFILIFAATFGEASLIIVRKIHVIRCNGKIKIVQEVKTLLFTTSHDFEVC
jgi:hypothetical protein